MVEPIESVCFPLLSSKPEPPAGVLLKPSTTILSPDGLVIRTEAGKVTAKTALGAPVISKVAALPGSAVFIVAPPDAVRALVGSMATVPVDVPADISPKTIPLKLVRLIALTTFALIVDVDVVASTVDCAPAIMSEIIISFVSSGPLLESTLLFTVKFMALIIVTI